VGPVVDPVAQALSGDSGAAAAVGAARRAFSLEFFPPRTAGGVQKLAAVRAQLKALAPQFCSVTFGAGGSTREGTLDTVLAFRSDGFVAAPHLSCIGGARENVRAVLEQYRAHDIHHLVALRGDAPSGSVEAGAFRYANELVDFIRAETGDWFHIDVAAYPEVHPQAKSPRDDLANFKRKVDAGANSAITQYFYNDEAYWRFVDDARAIGVGVPIVPGIMPIASAAGLARFSDNCGAEIPRWIRRRLESYGDDAASIRAFGLDVVTALCDRLLARGAPGLHFYTLNQGALTAEIGRRLGLATIASGASGR
jgi:methylenetetrahydrofolate reductase (NADPH)